MKDLKTKLNRLLPRFLNRAGFYAGFALDAVAPGGELAPGQLCSFNSELVKKAELRFFLITELERNLAPERARGFVVSVNPLLLQTSSDDILVDADNSPFHIPILVQFWNHRAVKLSHLGKPLAFLPGEIISQALDRSKCHSPASGEALSIFRNFEINNSPGVPLSENTIEIRFRSNHGKLVGYTIRPDSAPDLLAAASLTNDCQSKLYQLLHDFVVEKSATFFIRNLGQYGLKIIGFSPDKMIMQLKFCNGRVKNFYSHSGKLLINPGMLASMSFEQIKSINIVVKPHEENS